MPLASLELLFAQEGCGKLCEGEGCDEDAAERL